MTNEAIFKQAIEKAVENGFEDQTPLYDAVNDLDDQVRTNEYFEIIFDHSFAEAFWGKNIVDEFGYKVEPLSPSEIQDNFPKGLTHRAGKTLYTNKQVAEMEECWQYNLPIMVLEEEPLKYIEKFLWK